jgi:serine phosphatase RsbU (regulator of sigma subunit)
LRLKRGPAIVLVLLENVRSTSPQELLNRLMADLDLFVGNTPQHDDVTCMLLKA